MACGTLCRPQEYPQCRRQRLWACAPWKLETKTQLPHPILILSWWFLFSPRQEKQQVTKSPFPHYDEPLPNFTSPCLLNFILGHKANPFICTWDFIPTHFHRLHFWNLTPFPEPWIPTLKWIINFSIAKNMLWQFLSETLPLFSLTSLFIQYYHFSLLHSFFVIFSGKVLYCCCFVMRHFKY